MSTKQIALFISLFLFVINCSVFADYKEDSKVIKISGGEDYTLILTQNNWPWACGDNAYYQLGIGNTTADQFSPVRVRNGGMETPSGYLENINDMDAGYIHSLAVDVNEN